LDLVTHMKNRLAIAGEKALATGLFHILIDNNVTLGLMIYSFAGDNFAGVARLVRYLQRAGLVRKRILGRK